MSETERSQVFKVGNFSFSGADINSLESTEYTLFGLCLDSSVSLQGHQQQLKEALKTSIQSCQKSPRSDNLMIRVVEFDVKPRETHGFKELNKCALSDYDNLLSQLGGATAL